LLFQSPFGTRKARIKTHLHHRPPQHCLMKKTQHKQPCHHDRALQMWSALLRGPRKNRQEKVSFIGRFTIPLPGKRCFSFIRAAAAMLKSGWVNLTRCLSKALRQQLHPFSVSAQKGRTGRTFNIYSRLSTWLLPERIFLGDRYLLLLFLTNNCLELFCLFFHSASAEHVMKLSNHGPTAIIEPTRTGKNCQAINFSACFLRWSFILHWLSM
jgi:hypothetical protein